jgi:pyridoxal phosphate enzyme (YggS family)
MSTIAATVIRSNVARVREGLDAAARASGRDPAGIALVGVTKSVGVLEAKALLEAGVRDLGENRPEELLRKASHPELGDARWHLIGTYQRRKVRDTLAPVALVHSVDSVALAEALSARAAALGRDVPCLFQVNVSGETSKHGFAPEALRRALDSLRRLPALVWSGLMTMAPEGASSDACRRIFAATREFRDALRDRELELPHLSMGMSGDYVEAVLEGATLVRVGTALFRVASAGPDS